MRYNVSQLKANVCIICNEHPTHAYAPTRAACMPLLCDRISTMDRREDFLSRGFKDIPLLSINSGVPMIGATMRSKVDRFSSSDDGDIDSREKVPRGENSLWR